MRRSRSVTVGYLAFLSLSLAFGVDISLPAFTEIRSSFGLSPDDTSITLIVTLYFLGFAVGQLFFGVLSDRIGRQRALGLGYVLYVVGAIASAVAPTFAFLLIARLVWGLGASSPGVMRSAIVRDLYSGDEMSRIVTIVMAVFLVGPILVPFVGTGLLRLGSWPIVFYAAVLVALAAAAMTLAFGETLPVDQRRPLSARPMLAALRRVVTTRATVGRIVAQTLFSGSFFVFLSSSQPIMDQIYGRGDQFALWFGLVGFFTIGLLVVNNSAIKRFGSRRLVLVVASIELILSAGAAATVYLGGVEPTFGLWFAWVAVASSVLTVATPLCNGLALEPMGEIAGTASAILGFATVAGGSALAAGVSPLLGESVAPMTLAYAAFAAVALAALVWADHD